MIEYKGYLGRVEFDAEAGVFHGEVVNTRDVITFQGESVADLTQAFRDSVDDYLAFCAERGEEPDKPFSGQFMTRVSPELHRQISVAAMLAGKSLNAWVTDQLLGAVTDANRTKAAKSRKSNSRRRKTASGRAKRGAAKKVR